mmetsp:Transcript_34063/g.77871  ORF Transcript_34063/g.77871 Transcript_34063/m.77871 type:complete len:329 (+) Transcript_34063:243-1229(+)
MSSRSKSSGRQAKSAKPPAARQETSETRRETTLAQDILMDLPLLMHGSGDARPEDVDPESVAVLAGCVERYVRSLVSAALDSLDARTDGQVVGGGGCLGVPPYRGGGESGGAGDRGAATLESSGEPLRKKRKVDYWDLPLGSSRDLDDAFDEGENSSLLKHRLMSGTGTASGQPPVAVEDRPLLGFAPVDLHEDERARGHYMTPSSALSARDFIFPICHDAELYERVKEVQASRRMMARDLVDESLMEIIRAEGAEIGKAPQVDLLDAVLSGGGGKGDAVPGSAGGKDKSDDKEAKKELMRMVGASLLDGDVEAMWPGCNPVMRPSWS